MRINDVARHWAETKFKNYKTNLLVETAQSGGGYYTRSQDRVERIRMKKLTVVGHQHLK